MGSGRLKLRYCKIWSLSSTSSTGILWFRSMMLNRKLMSVGINKFPCSSVAGSLLIDASSLVASAQISIRSRSCLARSFTRLLEIQINPATRIRETAIRASFHIRRESYTFRRFIATHKVNQNWRKIFPKPTFKSIFLLSQLELLEKMPHHYIMVCLYLDFYLLHLQFVL